MIFLPRRLVDSAGGAAWICPLLSCFVFVALFFALNRIMRMPGDGMFKKIQFILGKPLGFAVTLLILLWTVILSAFFVRHFAERVMLVYLTDSTTVFVVMSFMVVVGIALWGGVLGYARACELLFYFFVVLFFAVTLLGMFDGIKVYNVLPVSVEDSVGILKGLMYMFVPFSTLIYMTFFSDRVNFGQSIVKQGAVSSIFVSFATFAVLLLTLGRLGEFGVRYLELPYFSVTRQIAFLGPLRNIGSIVFSLWIVADFALVSTLSYSSVNLGKSLTKNRLRNIPILLGILVITLIAVLFWRDMHSMEIFFDIVIVPLSIIVSVGIPLLLYIVSFLKVRTFQSKALQVIDE
jgi:hypothetical protein